MKNKIVLAVVLFCVAASGLTFFGLRIDGLTFNEIVKYKPFEGLAFTLFFISSGAALMNMVYKLLSMFFPRQNMDSIVKKFSNRNNT